MASSLDFAFQKIATGLSGVAAFLSRTTGPRDMLSRLGWDTPPGQVDVGLSALDLDDLVTALSTLDVSISADASGVTVDAQYLQVAEEVASFLKGLDEVVNGFSAIPDYLAKTDIEAQFVTRLLDYVVVEALNSDALVVMGLFTFLGIVELQPFPEDPTIYQVAHVRRIVRWDRIPRVFGDIKGLFTDVYQWGEANFDSTPMVITIGSILNGLCAATSVRALPRRAEFALTGQDAPLADVTPMTQLMLSINRGLGENALDAGITVVALRPSAPGGSDAGFSIAPYLFGTTDLQFPLTSQLTFVLDATLDLTKGVALIVRAGSGASLKNNLTGGAIGSVLDGHLLVGLSYAALPGETLPILTIADGIGVTAASATVSGGVDASGGELAAMVTAKLSGGHFTLDSSQMDSFVSSLIPVSVDIPFDFGIGWSGLHGFFIEGSASPTITIGLHQILGPITIDTLSIGLDLGKGDTLPLELSVSGSANLGPLSISVDQIGMLVTLACHKGNLGPADLSLGFKPPNGLGIEIDAGPASGGGYIDFDPSQGQYAGVLDVSLLDIVQVKVIGVIDTKMPDGSSGFSFLLIITFDLPPIQLGFGFTLNGVGGLGGVNRTIAQGALQAGFKAHSLNSILFPPDPVANAPEIISNIRNFFPVAQDQYVFGPMLELGWGTPTLITLEVGVMLELPDPVVIVLLGLIDALLPDSDAALIQLHIDVLGTLDFGTKTLEIEGDLYDSSVLIYAMAGSLFFEVCWGDAPNFIYSLGGFNPQFNTAGMNIPSLERCTVSIGDGDNPRISASNYFAITSNSLQFGANVQAYASAAGFTIQGHLGFDVLIIFSPFSFEFDFSASFSASYEGINLLSLSVSGSFSGPRPWNLNGSASIGVLFWTVSVGVNLTWGDSTPVTIPQKPVLPDLVAALEAVGNWSAALPPGMTPAVSLTTPNPAEAIVLVYPMGTLSVRENVAPLNFQITRYGNATPSDGNLFSISDVKINDQPTTQQNTTEYFAPGQFNALSDADKLSDPAFELEDAGVQLGSSAIVAGADSPRTVMYQEFYIDSPTSFSRPTPRYQMPADIAAALSQKGAGYRSPILNTGMGKYSAGPTQPIKTADEGFVIASTSDLSVRTDLSPASGVTCFQARTALANHLAANPGDAGSLQVMAVYEVAA